MEQAVSEKIAENLVLLTYGCRDDVELLGGLIPLASWSKYALSATSLCI